MELLQISQPFLAGTNNFLPQSQAVTESNSGDGIRQTDTKSSAPFVEDPVQISREGRNLSEYSRPANSEKANQSSTTTGSRELNAQEQAKLLKLQQRDREVKQHEQAHLAAAGSLTRGGASYSYQKGPDGNSYAVGGEVGIDVSKESSPEATIMKMQTVKRAALAPASPSSADRRIAAQATVKEAQARQEIARERQVTLLEAETENTHVDQTGPIQANSKKSMNDAAPTLSSLKEKLAIYNAINNGF